MTEKKDKDPIVRPYFNSVTPFTTPAPLAPSTLRPQNPENAPPKIPLRPPAALASPVEENKDEHGFVTFLDNIVPDDMGGIIRGDSDQWIGRPVWYKETIGTALSVPLSLGEATMNSLLWFSDQGLDAYKWGVSALPGGMRTLDVEWEYASITNNKGGMVGEIDNLSAGMVGQIDAATRLTMPKDEGFGQNIVTFIGDQLARGTNPIGTAQALNTQVYTNLGDPLEFTNEDVASVVTPNGIDADLRDKIFSVGTPQGASSFVGDAVATVITDPVLWGSAGLGALRYGIKGTKWAGLTNQSLRSSDNVASFGQQIDRGLAGKPTGPSTQVDFVARNHNKPEVLLEHPFVKGPDAQDTVRWIERAGGDRYKTAAVVKANAGDRAGWESLRQSDPGLFDDMASAKGMRTLPDTGVAMTPEQRVLGEALVENSQRSATAAEQAAAKAAKEAADKAIVDTAAAGQTLTRGGSRFAGASKVANAWREGRAQAKWNSPVRETIDQSDGWVVDVVRATSSSRPVQTVRWVGAARPAGIVHLKGADNANSNIEVSAWLKHSDLTPEQRATAFSQYMQAATASERKAALESMELMQVEFVAKNANLTVDQARAIYTSYASKRALFSRQFAGKKGFAVAEDQSLVTAPGLYSELDESFAMLNVRVLDRVVSKHAPILKQTENVTEFLDAINSYWKLSVLMRIGYPLRNVTEGLLRSIAVAGVVMTNPQAITNIPSAVVLKAAGKRVHKRLAVQGEALRVANDNLRLARQSVVKARAEMRLDDLKRFADELDSARVQVAAAKEALAMTQDTVQVLSSISPSMSIIPDAQVIPMPASVKAYKLPEHKLMKAAEQEFDDALEAAALLDFRFSGGATKFLRESAGVYRNGSYRIARDGKKWNLFDGDSGELIKSYTSLREAQTGSSIIGKSPKAVKALEKKLGAARREALVKANALQRARDARIRAAEKANASVTREWKAAQEAADKKYLAELRVGKRADTAAVAKVEKLLKERLKRVEKAQKRVEQAELKSAKAFDSFDEVNQKVIAGTPRMSELNAAERKLIAEVEAQADAVMNSSASLARVIDAQRAGRIGSQGNQMGKNGPVLDSAFQGPDGELAMLLSSADETVAATYMYGYEAKRKALMMSRKYELIDPAVLDAQGMTRYWDEVVDRWNRSYRSDPMVRLWLGQTDNASARSSAKKWLASPDGNEYRASMNGVSRGERGTGKGRWELNDAKGHAIKENVDEYVDLIYAEFSREVPMEIRGTLLKRPMLPEEAAAAFGSKAPPSIAGRAELPKVSFDNPLKYARDKVDRGSSFIMKWLGSIPETRLLRHPFYSRQYDVAQREMYKLAYDQGIDVMSRSVQQRIATAAHKRALRSTRDTMYTIENISNSAAMLRWASPFFPAFENTIRTWGRIVYRNPAVLAWGQKLWNLPNSFGMIVDEDGNKVRSSNMFKDDNHFFIMPEVMAAGIAKIPFQSLVPVDEDGKPISNKVRRAGYNVVIQGGEWWHPGTGGMVAMPMAFALRGRPEMVDILKANMSKEVYFATFPADPNAPLWQNMLSTGMKRVNQLVGDDPDSAWAKTRLTMQRDAYIAAQIENRPFTKKDAEKADRRAQAFWWHAIGQAYTGFTASTTYLSPYAAQERIWAELRDDTTLAFDEKMSAFHAKVGSDDFDAITRSTSESTFGVDSNLAAYNRLKDHKGFAESLARRHGEETVGMFTNLGNTRERFSPAVYGELFDEEINDTSVKDRMEPEQYSEVQQQRDGTNFYYGEMAKLDQAAFDLGYADASSINTDAMDAVKKKLYALTKQQYPLWDQATYEDELPSRIRAAREIIDEIGPELGKTGEFVKAYLASRDRVAEALAMDRPEGYTAAEWEVAKDNVRDAMNESTLRMRQMDIGFSDWWDRWMQKDTFKVVQ